MIKLKKIQFFVFLLMFSCLEKEPEIVENLPEVNLSTAYPTSDIEIEVSAGLLANVLNNKVDYGIVWAETTNPTIENQKKEIGSIDQGVRFNATISNLKPGSKVFIRAFVKNIKNEIKYSNEIEVFVKRLDSWLRIDDLDFSEGQFTGIATKMDGINLTFLRLNQFNEWEQYKHYNGSTFRNSYAWIKEKFSFPQFSPRQNPFFFSLNLSKENISPTAFLGGGFAVNSNAKVYLKDFYWVFGPQNYLQPIPFLDGPIAHFSLNRNEYFLEENNVDRFWSYFSIEEFIRQEPFPKLVGNFDYLGVSTESKGYILAQNLNEKEVQLIEYDDVTNKWKPKVNFPGVGRLEGVCFSIKNKIYYGLGRTTSPVKGLSDIWEYNPATDSWKFFANYPGAGNVKVVAKDMGEYAVLFCGYQVRASDAGAEKYYNANDSWALYPNK